MAALEAAAPLVQNVVVTGEGREEIGILAWPSPAGKTLGNGLAAELRRRLQEAQAASPHTSSHTIRRLLVLTEPPSIDAGEITDKGYVNQRAVLKLRAALVSALYTDPGSALLQPCERTAHRAMTGPSVQWPGASIVQALMS